MIQALVISGHKLVCIQTVFDQDIQPARALGDCFVDHLAGFRHTDFQLAIMHRSGCSSIIHDIERIRIVRIQHIVEVMDHFQHGNKEYTLLQDYVNKNIRVAKNIYIVNLPSRKEPPMKIAIWNVNSVKTRAEHVATWLGTQQPDALMIQELKGLEFDAQAFEKIGYHALFIGQKAYNGVAILTKGPASLVLNKLPGDERDEQARYLEADYNGVRLINIYAPNGNPVDSEKFPYKLGWLKRLRARLADLRRDDIPFVIGGDFNIIPEAHDCYDPKAWENDALFRLESRQAFRAIINLGLTDAFRVYNQQDQQYTFWDYQAGAWPQNKGIRIDHFLLSPIIADKLINCTIDKEPRGWDKASDHTPVLLEIAA